jgi:hypothetical protein
MLVQFSHYYSIEHMQDFPDPKGSNGVVFITYLWVHPKFKSLFGDELID